MAVDSFLSARNPEMSLRQKIWQLNWGMMLLLSLVAGVGFAMLYSAANGSFEPWASAQMMRFGLGLGMMIVAALIDIRFWFRYAYLIYFTKSEEHTSELQSLMRISYAVFCLKT